MPQHRVCQRNIRHGRWSTFAHAVWMQRRDRPRHYSEERPGMYVGASELISAIQRSAWMPGLCQDVKGIDTQVPLTEARVYYRGINATTHRNSSGKKRRMFGLSAPATTVVAAPRRSRCTGAILISKVLGSMGKANPKSQDCAVLHCAVSYAHHRPRHLALPM